MDESGRSRLGVAVAAPKQASRVAVLGLLILLLVACQSGQERLELMAEELPLPSETVLVASVTEESQGAQDACKFTTLTQLYGSNASFEDVEDLYTAYLLDAGWTQVFLSWLPEELLTFRLNDEYQLAISPATESDIGFIFEEVSLEEVKAYNTVYTVTITYADWIARRGCPFPED